KAAGKTDRKTDGKVAGKVDGKKARELNELIRYTQWSVFRVTERIHQAAGKGVVTRGAYDVSGFRADADFMFWWIAPTSDDIQDLYARFRRTALGRACTPTW